MKYSSMNLEYRPIFYRTNNPENEESLQKLLASVQDINVYDTIYSQLSELIKLSNPGKLSSGDIEKMISEHIGLTELNNYGVWVYYPWAKNLVHLLDEEEFIKVRTNRNIYKILPEEIELLSKKKIGIIGLSVGQSIAHTIALERTCGELRLADFDDIELSNMNRIKAGVQDLGMSKVILAARQIAELDPFIKVKCFVEGLNKENISDFFTEDGKIDILIEECDGLEIKVLSRVIARQLGIPVIMDTNDNGMLDVERFDLEPERPIFHGRTQDLEGLSSDALIDKLKGLTVEEKVEFLAQIIGMENVSSAMKQSLAHMNKTIIGWPQLASAVTLGGAMVTDTCRKILLNKFKASGRFFVNFDDLIKETNKMVEVD